MHESGFVQLVDSSTRSGNILDLFFINKPSLVQKCHVVSGISDHEIVYRNYDIVSTIKSHKIYLWNNVNQSDMRDNMNNFTEEFCHQYTVETSVENLWVCLRDKLHDLLKHFVPHKNLRNNHQQPWITHDIKRLRRRKQLAYNRAKATKSSVHWQHYKELKKAMQRECRKAFRNYMSNAICDPYQSGKKKKFYPLCEITTF